MQENPYRKHVFDLYEKYQKAKKKNGPYIWGKAITCREYLHKINDSKKELDTFREIFGEFMSKEQATESYRELCRDSRSYPQN
jgi:hypothetical protein